MNSNSEVEEFNVFTASNLLPSSRAGGSSNQSNDNLSTESFKSVNCTPFADNEYSLHV